MESQEEAQQYGQMDHSAVNRQFVDDLVAGGDIGLQVIDLGCGTAAIPIQLCQRLDDVRVIGVDSSISMLEIAKVEVDYAGMLDRIFLEQGDAKAIDEFQESAADTVISNSLLHHLADPKHGLEAAFYLCRDEGRLFLRDLVRPGTDAEVEKLVALYAEGESGFAQQLLRQSFHAALTLDEIREIAGGFGIDAEHVQMSSDRHWTIDCQKPT
ncbi:C-methyltransferase CouO [Planctomycetes bacterium K23_9]|uniref:C-methyltransferase CouO n=2 Tax=Stieleria marina TaxID=1930275 RepID=A0A517NQJ3_9BACT|nr:C-methyltransferase CouO [Planctomycetes bacterium K23_9]